MNICGGWNIKDEAKAIIIHMVYQMGEAGVRKFKNALKHLEQGSYSDSATEMLDSRWAKQTPNRAKRLSDHMASL
jgi:lysozyme